MNTPNYLVIVVVVVVIINNSVESSCAKYRGIGVETRAPVDAGEVVSA